MNTIKHCSLPITSVVIETRQKMMYRIRQITEWHRRWFRFHREIIVSDVDPKIPGTLFVNCGIPPRGEHFMMWYSDLCIRWLTKLCDTSHILLWQWDGFIVNPELWTNEFLNYDYVGAPVVSDFWKKGIKWFRENQPGWSYDLNEADSIVGNGGFSLRSKKFLDTSSGLAPSFTSDNSPKMYAKNNEDFYLCVVKRKELEKKGIKFCPIDLASRFSKDEDDKRPIEECFGFHDRSHFEDVRKMMDKRGETGLKDVFEESNRLVLLQGKNRSLIIVCYPCLGEIPDEWLKHHKGFTPFVVVAHTEDEVDSILQEALDVGFRWGMVLRPEEKLITDVSLFGSILSDEDLSPVVFVGTESNSQEKVIVRLDKFRRYFRGQFILRQMEGAERHVSMENVTSTCSLKDKIKVVTLKIGEECKKMGVVFNHYRLPKKRLDDHFIWNDEFYTSADVRVFVVTDREYEVPGYAHCLVYPKPMSVFNISAASNYGIRFAIDCGCETILKTDTDIVLGEMIWRKMLNVDGKRAISPAYYMAMDYESRMDKFFRNVSVLGVCCMTSKNWQRAHFHEGCCGYGHDDNVLLEAVRRIGIVVDTVGGIPVWHISHDGKGLTDGERNDHWNRSSFNPSNPQNEQFINNPVYDNPWWGLPGMDKTYIIDARKNFPEIINRFIGLNCNKLSSKRIIALVPIEFEIGYSMGIRSIVCDDKFEIPTGKDIVLLNPDESLV